VNYDIYVVGTVAVENESMSFDPVSPDKISRFIGGAVIFSAYAEIASGAKVGALVKIHPDDRYLLGPFFIRDLTVLPSRQTTTTQLIYHTPDRERRTSRFSSCADTIIPADLPEGVEAEIFQMAGSFLGEFDDALFAELAGRGRVACDLQGYVRRVADDGQILYHDWEKKMTYLPYIDFLKADAAEAEVITGQNDRYKAARMLHAWGAKEIMITHHTEVIVFDGQSFYVCPLRPRDLTGRSGRGDTAFGSYLATRLHTPIRPALRYAAALVSLKMEAIGPFKGSRENVETFIQLGYPDCAVYSLDDQHIMEEAYK